MRSRGCQGRWSGASSLPTVSVSRRSGCHGSRDAFHCIGIASVLQCSALITVWTFSLQTGVTWQTSGVVHVCCKEGRRFSPEIIFCPRIYIFWRAAGGMQRPLSLDRTMLARGSVNNRHSMPARDAWRCRGRAGKALSCRGQRSPGPGPSPGHGPGPGFGAVRSCRRLSRADAALSRAEGPAGRAGDL